MPFFFYLEFQEWLESIDQGVIAMKHVCKKGESNIGWFKLAQMVSRGEKEKALGLFKLLSYSFDDTAYILQIEGDLLQSFDDKEAVTKYQQAAFLYKKEKRVAASIAVYEHLLTLEPFNYVFLSMMLELYARLNWPEKYVDILERIAKGYTGKQVSKDQVETMVKNSFDVMLSEHSRSVVQSLKETVSKKKGLGEVGKTIEKVNL